MGNMLQSLPRLLSMSDKVMGKVQTWQRAGYSKMEGWGVKGNMVKKKFIEWKLKLVEKEIKEWEDRQLAANVQLRKHKNKQWELIEELERLECGDS